MKKAVLVFLFAGLFLSNGYAHNGGGFLEQCDKIPLPNCTHNWNDVTSTDNALYLVGGDGYCFIYYHKGGIKLVNTGLSDTLTGVQFVNNTVGYAWGKNGTLIKTSDAGLNWASISTGTTHTISRVEFIDENTGFFMVGDTLSNTTNGGASWNTMTLPPTITFTDFHFFSSQNGQICGQTTSPSITGYLYETTNGGASWSLIHTENCAFTKLDYITANKGYLYGTTTNQPLLYETTNTGSNWAVKYSSSSWSLGSDVVLFNNQSVFVTNEATGAYMYDLPTFLDPIYGLIFNPINIYSTSIDGIDALYVIDASGLFRYTTGRVVCKQINFATGIVPNPTNPYNVMVPGKKIRFRDLLVNVTLDTIIQVNGKIRCQSPYITITDSLGTYGAILSNIGTSNNAWTLDQYEIELSDSIPDDYVIHLEFIYYNRVPAKATNDRSIIDIPIIKSPFAVTSMAVVDTGNVNGTTGNNNGIVEPYETAALTPSLTNTSEHYFSAEVGKLQSPFNEIFVWDNKEYPVGSGLVVQNSNSFGSFNPNQTRVPSSNYVITDSFNVDYKIPLTLVLTGPLSSLTDSVNHCYYYDYFGINYCWGADFYLNSSFALPPDSLLPPPIKDLLPPDSIPPIPGLAIEVNEEASFTVYPNPNNGVFTIKTNGELSNSNIQVYDLLGQFVNYIMEPQNNTILVDISNAPNGLYFLQISSKMLKKTIKIIKN